MPAELGPPEHMLKRQPGYPPADHGVKLGLVLGGLVQQPRLVLGEHAAGRPEPGEGTYHGPSSRVGLW
jgi:hypothetical protein